MTSAHGSAATAGAAWLAAAVAAWLGATALFAAAVTPALFAVLPSRAMAGLVVGRTLPVLFVAGILVGALSAALAPVFLPAGRSRAVGAGAGGCMSIACAAGQFVIGARIRRVRVAIGPSLDAIGANDPLRVEFGRLHALSVVLLGVAAVAAAAALIAWGSSAGRTAAPRA